MDGESLAPITMVNMDPAMETSHIDSINVGFEFFDGLQTNSIKRTFTTAPTKSPLEDMEADISTGMGILEYLSMFVRFTIRVFTPENCLKHISPTVYNIFLAYFLCQIDPTIFSGEVLEEEESLSFSCVSGRKKAIIRTSMKTDNAHPKIINPVLLSQSERNCPRNIPKLIP